MISIELLTSRIARHTKENPIRTIVLSAVITALVAVGTVYVTPLRHFNLISPGMNEIDPSIFYAEYKLHPERYIFIDVRQPEEYAAAHPQGAINIPIADLTFMHYQLPATGKKIVVTCTTGRLAEIAYGYLENWGFQNMEHLTGGLRLWTLDDLPLDGIKIPSETLSAASR